MLGDTKYKFLRIYCWILRMGSLGILVLTLILALGIIPGPFQASSRVPQSPYLAPDTVALVGALSGLGSFIGFGLGISIALGGFAMADYLDSHLDIEQNTRETMELLRLMRRGQSPDIHIPYPYNPKSSRASSLNRYEDTPLGQYSQRKRD